MTWSDEQLERFLDGDLPSDSASRLGSDLRRDPGLRHRLEAVRSADELARRALMDEGPVESVGVRPVLIAVGPFAVAAGLVLVLLVMGGERKVLEPAPDQRRSSLVFSLPATNLVIESESVPPPPPDAGYARRFERALRDRDAKRAIEIYHDVTESGQKELLGVIASAFKRADVAETILAELTPHDQVLVCAMWLDEGVHESLSASWLARLARDGPAAKLAEQALNDRRFRPRIRNVMQTLNIDGVG